MQVSVSETVTRPATCNGTYDYSLLESGVSRKQDQVLSIAASAKRLIGMGTTHTGASETVVDGDCQV